jgi:hypothetical protein
MNFITSTLIKLGILKDDFDYRLVRASMVIIFSFFLDIRSGLTMKRRP